MAPGTFWLRSKLAKGGWLRTAASLLLLPPFLQETTKEKDEGEPETRFLYAEGSDNAPIPMLARNHPQFVPRRL